jgi:tRNA(Ile)-lysidine synthase
MIKLLKNFIKDFNIKNKSTLLSISGGIDSIVMAEIFNEAKLKFSIAHCNFGLRGVESKKDEIFVEKIAKKYKVRFYKKKFDTIIYSKQNNISIQMSARNLRYD